MKINDFLFQGNTPLHLSALNDHFEIVQILVEHNCKLNEINFQISPVGLIILHYHVRLFMETKQLFIT